MHSKLLLRLVPAAVLAVVIAASAVAQDSEPHWYIGTRGFRKANTS